MRVAMFKSAEYGFEAVMEEVKGGVPGYVRTSEYVDVEFPPLSDTEVTLQEVAILKEAKKDLQISTESKLAVLDRKIGELLALPQSI